MRYATKRFLQSFFRTVILVQLLTTSGCFLLPEDKNSGSTGAQDLVLKESIYLDRIGDGDKARLSFTTSRPAHCSLEWYPQPSTANPEGNTEPRDLQTGDCSSIEKPRTDFTEVIKDLRTDSLYLVRLIVWPEGTSRSAAVRVLVKEVSSDGQGVDGLPYDGKISSLNVARLDIPLKSIEVHRHDIGSSLSIDEIKSELSPEFGCKQGPVSADRPFRSAAADIGLSNLATRDFAAGTAKPHDSAPGRLRLTYPSVNEGLDKLSFLYQKNGRDVYVPMRPIEKLQNIELTMATPKPFEKPSLGEPAPAVVTISGSEPLKVSWTTGGRIGDLSYLWIQVGPSHLGKAISCTFKASDRIGVVPSNLLTDLGPGEFNVTATLESNRLWLKDAWLLSSFDWRRTRIRL